MHMSPRDKRTQLEQDHKDRCVYVENQNRQIQRTKDAHESRKVDMKEETYENTVRYLERVSPSIHKNTFVMPDIIMDEDVERCEICGRKKGVLNCSICQKPNDVE